MTAPAQGSPPPRVPHAFGALRHRNFRLFLGGQLVSLTGTWMQSVAQGWLVLELTDSAFYVGLVSALGSLPVLLFTLYGGVVADRVNRRRFVLLLQGLMLVEALALAILTHTGMITVGALMALAAIFGTLSAFEIPARQAFVVEMVGKEDLMNAIALNSSVFNVTRVLGPAIAGVLIASAGIAACFYVNAASYVAVIAGLLAMRLPPWTRPEPVDAVAAFREGMRYVFGQRRPRTLIALAAVYSVFGLAFITMLPVYAARSLGVGAPGYGALMAAVGVGASGGALVLAGFGHRFRRRFVLVTRAGMVFGAALVLAAVVRSFPLALLLLALAGCAMVATNVLTNTTLQTEAPDHLRGRVIGFYSFVVVGLTPVSSFQAGWISERFGVEASLALGGALCLAAAAWVGTRKASR
ncbi:MAG TPA: MFS transporter [Gemmatimonadales bacterium]|nr:MFS transporter [Gemmatimonadales bacterium]